MFETSEWQSVYMIVKKEDPPSTPPRLNDSVHMIASLGDTFRARRPNQSPRAPEPPEPPEPWALPTTVANGSVSVIRHICLTICSFLQRNCGKQKGKGES